MRRITLILALLALGAAFPGSALGGQRLTAVIAHDIPPRGERVLSSRSPASPFSLIGAHWAGNGRVEVRVRRPSGRWSRWHEIHPDAAPDVRSREGRGGLRPVRGDPLWVGRAVAFETRTAGSVRRLRVFTVRSDISRVPVRNLTAAGAPSIVSRAGWGADESLRRATPQTAETLRLAIVHHTAGANTYSREEAPAVVRGIMAYHVKANGWNDIGYNALIDRFGTVYEGRFGGVSANVVGAHARGFNTGSYGVALMGEYTAAAPPPAALDALVRTLAWRLDLGHVDPVTTMQVVSAGSDRFPTGIPVFLRAIAGHRDTGLTACPGDKLYAQLSTIARRVAALGLPKLYDPTVTGTWGGPLTISARLSSALSWRIRVASRATGDVVLDIAGSGVTASAVWETAGLAPAAYEWSIEAPGVTPATGAVNSTTTGIALAISSVSAEPEVISPEPDGTLDSALVTYRLTAPANVSVRAVDLTGAEVAVVEAPRWRRAGEHTFAFDGRTLADGMYELRLVATGQGGQSATRSVRVGITRTLGNVALTSPFFTPNGDGRDDTVGLGFTLAAPAAVRFRVFNGNTWVATPFAGPMVAGPQTIVWDGRKRLGLIREGSYVAELEVTDVVAAARLRLPFVVDWTPPAVGVVSVTPPRLRVSEAAVLELVINGRPRRVGVKQEGVIRLKGIERLTTLSGTATDRYGNVGPVGYRAPAPG